MAAVSRFKSAEGAERFLAAYNAMLALWPLPHEAMDVPTRLGTTHLNVAGPPDTPPLLLIHGAQISSTIWYRNVEPLSRHFRVYAPDVVDQLGLSQPARKLRTPQDCLDWLTDLLDALQIERAVLVGHSEGGWQAFNFALHVPDRVERLVLLSPAPVFARLRPQLILRMIPVFLLPLRQSFYWYFRWTTTMPLPQGHPLVEQFIAGIRTFKPQELTIPVTSVFSDDDLRRVHTPTLLLVGAQEVVYDPQQVIDRARRLMPNVEADLIAGGGHIFPVDQAEATNARMVAFLTEGGATAQ